MASRSTAAWPVEGGPFAGGTEPGADTGVSDDETFWLDPERRGYVVSRELRVREDDIAALGRIDVLAPMHGDRPLRAPLGMMMRVQIVNRRGAEAGALRRSHPVGVEKCVERTQEPLSGGMPEPAPGGAGRM